ncbi:MAG TPA: APC family permease [Phycisphaerales bacterium]|nr:APC family permease [Phycisphaerales bacterium]HMP37087.1 APC family permease [Phycisphaerales bacterium]
MSRDIGGTLRRELGVFGATMMGLGSIVGTGIFVSIGIAVGVAGPAVVLAIAVAAALAVCNALSSAQLAANHPTSGGTYEYGYTYLTPWLGFSAGWMFLCAKAASAATAALGFAGYAFVALGVPESGWRVALALAAVVVLVALVLSGLRRSNITNIIIVSVTLLALVFFVAAGLPSVLRSGSEHFTPFFESPNGDGRVAILRVLEASALMFVAYTGYGRIATMGEEVREPRRTIPRAIIITLLVSMALYLAVGAVGVGAAGVSEFGAVGTERGAPLAVVARGFDIPGAGLVLSIGAVTAMLGVLLNLVLGLSRVVLAMGRRGDLPRLFARVNAGGTTPAPAVVLVGAVILGLTAIGSIKLAWSFSAFTVLLYYAVTNLAAIRLPKAQRLYHPAIAWLGLLGCLSLAFWVEPRVWLAGLGVLGLGLVTRWLFHLRRSASAESTR